MPANRNSRLSVSGEAAVITAPNLQDAYRRVRREFGGNAVILGTRSVTRRQETGLGREKVVEVLVQGPGGAGGSHGPATPVPAGTRGGLGGRGAPGGMPADILAEIARIETLAAAIEAQFAAALPPDQALLSRPAAKSLLAAGTRPSTVQKLLQRYTSETGAGPEDPAAVMSWLARQVRASNCDWDGFNGCHAFLGYSGSDRSELILATAARLQALGRLTLVLVLFPEDSGQVRRLQTEASKHGYDAAVLQKENQLQRCEAHLARYDVVLMEMPDLERLQMANEGPLYRWLAPNPGCHRHLVTPLDGDLDDLAPLREESRHWNCDWMAVTRMNRTRRPGKLLDLLEMLPLPVSLVMAGGAAAALLDIARSGDLLDRVLAAGARKVEPTREGAAGTVQES